MWMDLLGNFGELTKMTHLSYWRRFIDCHPNTFPLFPLSSIAHCGPGTRWEQKQNTSRYFVILHNCHLQKKIWWLQVCYQTGSTQDKVTIFSNATDQRGTIKRLESWCCFLETASCWNAFQLHLGGHVKQADWNHFANPDLTNTALLSLTLCCLFIWNTVHF